MPLPFAQSRQLSLTAIKGAILMDNGEGDGALLPDRHDFPSDPADYAEIISTQRRHER
jgi:hypothetical protein